MKPHSHAVEYHIPRRLEFTGPPEEGAVPLVWLPPTKVKEAEERGELPIAMVMYPSELKSFFEDRGSAAVLRELKKLEQTRPQQPEPFMMRKAAYGKRVGFSERFVDGLVERGLPVAGKGRRLRVIVKEADEWLKNNLDHLDITDSEEIEDKAAAAARRTRKRRMAR